MCNILHVQGRNNDCIVEGKEELAIFSQPQRNLPQTEKWKIILYQNTFMKFAYFKCGRDLQYPTGVEELLKCERKRRA